MKVKTIIIKIDNGLEIKIGRVKDIWEEEDRKTLRIKRDETCAVFLDNEDYTPKKAQVVLDQIGSLVTTCEELID